MICKTEVASYNPNIKIIIIQQKNIPKNMIENIQNEFNINS